MRPDCAFFGQKDAAQVAVLRRMVRDLDMDVEMVVCPIVREKDGLAMSSRNAYLTSEQRQQALVLHRVADAGADCRRCGRARCSEVDRNWQEVIAEEPGARLDYFAIVDPDTLDPVSDVSRGALVAVAAYVGATRLIDKFCWRRGDYDRVEYAFQAYRKRYTGTL